MICRIENDNKTSQAPRTKSVSLFRERNAWSISHEESFSTSWSCIFMVPEAAEDLGEMQQTSRFEESLPIVKWTGQRPMKYSGLKALQRANDEVMSCTTKNTF